MPPKVKKSRSKQGKANKAKEKENLPPPPTPPKSDDEIDIEQKQEQEREEQEKEEREREREQNDEGQEITVAQPETHETTKLSGLPTSSSTTTGTWITAQSDVNDDNEKEDEDEVKSPTSMTSAPPPPPAPPLPTPPSTTTNSTIYRAPPARRQSTSATSPVHARSATEPSSSSPPVLDNIIAHTQMTLKRNNTINSFSTPQTPKYDSSVSQETSGVNSVDGDVTPPKSVRRATSPPPPIKPKPASLQHPKRKMTHDRQGSSSSITPLLKAALVQGATAASGSKPPSISNYNNHNNDAANSNNTGIETPERRNSVSQIARSLEATLQFSPPGSPGSPGLPGTPKGQRKRGSMHSTKTVDEETNKINGEIHARFAKDTNEGRSRSTSPTQSADLKTQLSSIWGGKSKNGSSKSPAREASRDRVENTGRARSTSPTPSADLQSELASVFAAKAKRAQGRRETSETSVFSKNTEENNDEGRSKTPTPPAELKAALSSMITLKAKSAKAGSVTTDVSTTASELFVTAPSTPPPPSLPVSVAALASTIEASLTPPAEEKVEAAFLPTIPTPKSEKAFSPSPPPPVPQSEKDSSLPSIPTPPSAPSEGSSVSEKTDTQTPSKRLSIPPQRPPPPPPVESQEGSPTVSPDTSSPPAYEEPPVPEKTGTSRKRLSLPPSRPPPPPPEESGSDAEQVQAEEEPKPRRPHRAVPPLPPPVEEHTGHEEVTAGGEYDSGAEGILSGRIVVQEPEEMSDVDETGDAQINVEGDDSPDEDDEESGGDDSSSEDGRLSSFKSARSRNESPGPPTPPIKPDFHYPLASKWSRNTSAVPSANASVTTLAQSADQSHQMHSLEEETLAHDHDTTLDTTLEDSRFPAIMNVNDKKDVDDDSRFPPPPSFQPLPTAAAGEWDDPRFPPVSSFPPPPPLPPKKATVDTGKARLGTLGEAEESSMSFNSMRGHESSEEEGDGDDEESTDPRVKSKSRKATLTSAIAAVFSKSSPDINDASTVSHTVSESAEIHSSDDETDPIARQRRARLAKLDAVDLPRPAPFLTAGEGTQGQSQSAPQVPQVWKNDGGGTMRQIRLSSKLLPITAAKRMNTMPVSAWGKNKMVMSSETVGTIGTIGTEPGDLDTSQFGSVSGMSNLLDRAKTENGKRPQARRQTTSQSQASRFVEDLPMPLPFLKRSADPLPRRSQTISFSSRARTGSQVTATGGPPTRKISLITEMRAATLEAAERPLSTISGDFVLVEEPEEFDIPRAEWDLPRIPSGSLNFPSTVDLTKTNGRENGRREKGGPSSAPATTAPSVPLAPSMQHSRSVSGVTGTTGTTGTYTTGSKSSGTASTSKSLPGGTISLAPPISLQPSSGSENANTANPKSARLSSDDLLDLWGRVGVYMSDAAALLHDKSRRVLVGDGTYPGFVLSVARQVPSACIPSRTARYPYGHLIYFQTAQTVHKRYAEILPGDIIVLQNALFKGVRGPLHSSYQEELGTKGDPVVGVIGEFEARKSKVRVYQANQHVGIQTVEYVSYRFEDLKSGTIKIFRAPDS